MTTSDDLSTDDDSDFQVSLADFNVFVCVNNLQVLAPFTFFLTIINF